MARKEEAADPAMKGNKQNARYRRRKRTGLAVSDGHCLEARKGESENTDSGPNRATLVICVHRDNPGKCSQYICRATVAGMITSDEIGLTGSLWLHIHARTIFTGRRSLNYTDKGKGREREKGRNKTGRASFGLIMKHSGTNFTHILTHQSTQNRRKDFKKRQK